MLRRFLFFVCSLICFFQADAKVTLPEIIGDNMVLQQNSEVNLWGKSSGKAVSVTSSWNGTPSTTQVEKDGFWKIKIHTPNGSYTPQSLTISDGESVTLGNILIGEVWFASGQSNMEMPLKGFNNCPIKKSNEIIAFAGDNKNKIRFATIPKTPSYTLQNEVGGKWKVCNSENAPDFSATAFFFATNLNKALDVPVGIINCSWGGSRVESWLPKEILQNYKDIDLTKAGIEKVIDYKRPLLMYNGMLHALTSYTIKGFIWYQGESNVGHEDTYADRLVTMVKQWRSEWGEGNIPFYFVEIAPYNYGWKDQGAFLREAQFKAQTLIPNSGMISTNDLVLPYENNQIHPCNKLEVGQRLAFMALCGTYDWKGIACHGPEYKSMEVNGNAAYLSFNYADSGFSRMKDIKGFEICGEDRTFYPAEVKVQGQVLVASSAEVQKPVAVRYCFRNFKIGNIGNLNGLPMVPFRTDSFEK